MNYAAQASIEYLLAIALSFFLTLVVLGALVSFTANTKEEIECKIGFCDPLKQHSPEKNILSANDLFFLASIIVLYFVEFFAILVFLRYLGRPEKKITAKKTMPIDSSGDD